MSNALPLLPPATPPPTDTWRAGGGGGGKVTELGCVAPSPASSAPPAPPTAPAATASASALRCGGELAAEPGRGPSRKGPRRSGDVFSSAPRAEATRRRPPAAPPDEASSDSRPWW